MALVMPAGNSVILAIPDFARRYFPVLNDPSNVGVPVITDDLVISFLNAELAVLSCVRCSQSILAQGLAIPGGAQKVKLQNNDASNPINAMHRFALGL
jgi:hypothetical protein